MPVTQKTKRPKRVSIGLTIYKDSHVRAKQSARREGVTLAEFIRAAIDLRISHSEMELQGQ